MSLSSVTTRGWGEPLHCHYWSEVRMQSKIKKSRLRGAAFCLIRIITLSLRIGWAEHRSNANLALTSQIFVDAGAIVLYLVNFALASRIVRSHHPQISGTIFKGARLGLIFLTLTAMGLIMIANIQMAYTLTDETIRMDRNIVVFGATFNAG